MRRRNFIAGALTLLTVPSIKAQAEPKLYGIVKVGEWAIDAGGHMTISNWHLDFTRIPFWMRWNRRPIAEFRKDGRFFNLGREVPSLRARMGPGAQPAERGIKWDGRR